MPLQSSWRIPFGSKYTSGLLRVTFKGEVTMNTRTQARANLSLTAHVQFLIRKNAALRFLFLALLFSMLGFPLVSRTYAAGVVGTGTPSSCTETALDTALTGGGTVTFNCGGAATITVTSPKTISSDTTIDGGGLITISGGNSVRVFTVNHGIALNLRNLAVSDGGGVGHAAGGAVYNWGGTVTIDNSSFLNNSVIAGGGAICNYDYPFAPPSQGVMTISNSTFSGNRTTAGSGGGSAIDNGSVLTVTNSTFFNNTSGGSGTIGNGNGTVNITNSTFFSNSVAIQGGGIYAYGGTVNVVNNTFSGNNATTAGGSIFNESALVTLYNTIVANSTSGGNCSGTITNGGYNLDSGATCGFGTTSGSLSNTNPLLAPLGNYGGRTQTMGLLSGSPAIDAVIGNANCPATDQRGVARPQGTWCDIGAFEGVVRILFLPLILKK
jgi:hypothetical protein